LFAHDWVGVVQSNSAKLTAAGAEVTAIRYEDALTMAVGTSTGHVLLYDLRSSTPIMWKDHRYGLPIIDIKFHNASKKFISSDSKIIKLWDRNTVLILYTLFR
jgi:ribosome biogenesis protein ENP2